MTGADVTDESDGADSICVIPSEVEEWSEPGGRDIDGKAERPSERERASQSLICIFGLRCLASTVLSQRRRFFFATFELEHHSFEVLVILMVAEELQTFLRIAPF